MLFIVVITLAYLNLNRYGHALTMHHPHYIHFPIIQMPKPQSWIGVEKYYGLSNENELEK
jgi:hypothetical protein